MGWVSDERGNGSEDPAEARREADVAQSNLSGRILAFSEVEDIRIELVAQVAAQQR